MRSVGDRRAALSSFAGEGAWLIETAGRPLRLLDWVQSWGPLIFGPRRPRDDRRRRTSAAAAGNDVRGGDRALEVELAEPRSPTRRSVGRAWSGSSRGHRARRCIGAPARAWIHRPDREVLKFAGGYHGHADAFLAEAGSGSRDARRSRPRPGVPASVVGRDGRRGLQRRRLRWRARSSVMPRSSRAVFVEPVAGNMGCVSPAAPGFLEGLRRVCDAAGALLDLRTRCDHRLPRRATAARRSGYAFRARPDSAREDRRRGTAARGVRGPDGDHVPPRAGRRRLPGRDAFREPARDRGRSLGAAPAAGARPSTIELERRSALLEQGLAPFGPDGAARVGAMLTFFVGRETPVTHREQLDSRRYGELFRHLLASGVYLAPSQYECLFPSLAHG